MREKSWGGIYKYTGVPWNSSQKEERDRETKDKNERKERETVGKMFYAQRILLGFYRSTQNA